MSAEKQELDALAREQPVRYLRPPRKPEVRRRAWGRQLLRWSPRILLGAGLALVVGLALYEAYGYARSAPRFRLKDGDSIELAGVQYAAPALLRMRFAEDAGRSVFWILLEQRRRALEEIPWIAAARVQRLLPNRIRIVVEERIPVAFVRQAGELMLVDASGVLLERPEGTEFTFPVVTGLDSDLTQEERQARLALYLALRAELDAEEKSYTADISEVDLSDPEDLRATVLEGGQPVLLHFGRDRYREKYEAYRQHRTLWQKSGEAVYSVDLRYRGQLVLNPEGDARPPGKSR